MMITVSANPGGRDKYIVKSPQKSYSLCFWGMFMFFPGFIFVVANFQYWLWHRHSLELQPEYFKINLKDCLRLQSSRRLLSCVQRGREPVGHGVSKYMRRHVLLTTVLSNLLMDHAPFRPLAQACPFLTSWWQSWWKKNKNQYLMLWAETFYITDFGIYLKIYDTEYRCL